jgi:hypothetical protein
VVQVKHFYVSFPVLGIFVTLELDLLGVVHSFVVVFQILNEQVSGKSDLVVLYSFFVFVRQGDSIQFYQLGEAGEDCSSVGLLGANGVAFEGKLSDLGAVHSEVVDLVDVRDPVVGDIHEHQVGFAFKAFDLPDEVVVQVQSFEQFALGQAFHHLNLVEGKNKDCQVY